MKKILLALALCASVFAFTNIPFATDHHTISIIEYKTVYISAIAILPMPITVRRIVVD